MAVGKPVQGVTRRKEKNQTNTNNIQSVAEPQVFDGRLQVDDRDIDPGVRQ